MCLIQLSSGVIWNLEWIQWAFQRFHCVFQSSHFSLLISLSFQCSYQCSYLHFISVNSRVCISLSTSPSTSPSTYWLRNHCLPPPQNLHRPSLSAIDGTFRGQIADSCSFRRIWREIRTNLNEIGWEWQPSNDHTGPICKTNFNKFQNFPFTPV